MLEVASFAPLMFVVLFAFLATGGRSLHAALVSVGFEELASVNGTIGPTAEAPPITRAIW